MSESERENEFSIQSPESPTPKEEIEEKEPEESKVFNEPSSPVPPSPVAIGAELEFEIDGLDFVDISDQGESSGKITLDALEPIKKEEKSSVDSKNSENVPVDDKNNSKDANEVLNETPIDPTAEIEISKEEKLTETKVEQISEEIPEEKAPNLPTVDQPDLEEGNQVKCPEEVCELKEVETNEISAGQEKKVEEIVTDSESEEEEEVIKLDNLEKSEITFSETESKLEGKGIEELSDMDLKMEKLLDETIEKMDSDSDRSEEEEREDEDMELLKADLFGENEVEEMKTDEIKSPDIVQKTEPTEPLKEEKEEIDSSEDDEETETSPFLDTTSCVLRSSTTTQKVVPDNPDLPMILISTPDEVEQMLAEESDEDFEESSSEEHSEDETDETEEEDDPGVITELITDFFDPQKIEKEEKDDKPPEEISNSKKSKPTQLIDPEFLKRRRELMRRNIRSISSQPVCIPPPESSSEKECEEGEEEESSESEEEEEEDVIRSKLEVDEDGKMIPSIQSPKQEEEENEKKEEDEEEDEVFNHEEVEEIYEDDKGNVEKMLDDGSFLGGYHRNKDFYKHLGPEFNQKTNQIHFSPVHCCIELRKEILESKRLVDRHYMAAATEEDETKTEKEDLEFDEKKEYLQTLVDLDAEYAFWYNSYVDYLHKYHPNYISEKEKKRIIKKLERQTWCQLCFALFLFCIGIFCPPLMVCNMCIFAMSRSKNTQILAFFACCHSFCFFCMCLGTIIYFVLAVFYYIYW